MKKNIIANLLGRFWSILSSFLFIPLYIKILGFESYSVISFTLMITGIMVILDGGLTATLSREFSRNDTSQNEKRAIYYTLETCYIIIVALCISILFFSSNFIAHYWLDVQGFSVKQVSTFIKIVSFEIGLQFLFRFYMGGLLGLEKQVEANKYQVGWGLLRNGLVLIPIYYYSDLDVFFIWQVIATFIFTVLIKFSLQKTIGEKMFKISFKIERQIIQQIGGFAGGMMLIAFVSALNTQLDKITVSKLLSIENLGYYTLAISLAQGLIIVVNPVATALLPRFTAYYSSGKKELAESLFKDFSLYISVIIIVIMLIISFFSRDILWIWTGDKEIVERTFVIVPIVLWSYGMISLQVLPYNIVIANGNTKINNILGITSLVITIPGYLVFTKKYGTLGAASVFCFVQTCTTITYFYLVNKTYLNLSFIYDILLKRLMFPLILISIVVFGLSKIPNVFQHNRLLDFMWVGACFLITLVIAIIVFVPFKVIRNYLFVKQKEKL